MLEHMLGQRWGWLTRQPRNPIGVCLHLAMGRRLTEGAALLDEAWIAILKTLFTFSNNA